MRELTGCLTLRTWHDAPGRGPPGPPAPSPLLVPYSPRRSGLGLGIRSRAGGVMLSPPDLAGDLSRALRILSRPRPIPPPPGVDWVWGAVAGSRADPKREPEGRWGLRRTPPTPLQASAPAVQRWGHALGAGTQAQSERPRCIRNAAPGLSPPRECPPSPRAARGLGQVAAEAAQGRAGAGN